MYETLDDLLEDLGVWASRLGLVLSLKNPTLACLMYLSRYRSTVPTYLPINLVTRQQPNQHYIHTYDEVAT